MVLKLLKALYGLRIAPLLWFTHLAVSLERLGLSPIANTLNTSSFTLTCGSLCKVDNDMELFYSQAALVII